MAVPEQIRLEARRELARRYFYDYYQLRYPKHYTGDRAYLREVCGRLQGFMEQNTKRILVMVMPPRHYQTSVRGSLVDAIAHL